MFNQLIKSKYIASKEAIHTTRKGLFYLSNHLFIFHFPSIACNSHIQSKMKKAATKRRPRSKIKCAKVARKRIRKLFAKKKRKVIKKKMKRHSGPCNESESSSPDNTLLPYRPLRYPQDPFRKTLVPTYKVYTQYD